MADPILGITQGETVYFYDTSTGDVVSHSWSFDGGTPSTSTDQNVYVTFNSSNISGFSVSLSVTDSAGITATVTKNDIISVSPETITSSFTFTSSSRLMSQSQTYTSGATASSGISNYSWSIPGLGTTSGTNLSSVSHTEDNWYNVAGTYAGAPNSSVLTTSSLTVTSNASNTSTSNNSVTYYKMGPSEQYALDGIGLSGPYYDVSYVGNSGSLGLGGSSLVFLLDQDPYGPTGIFINDYFHSNNEVFYFIPNTTDLGTSSTPAPIRTKAVIIKSAWDIGGLSYSANSEFSSGNYILPGGSSDVLLNQICITDYTTTSPNTLSNLITSRGWTNADVVELLKNTYYTSSSSKYIENTSNYLTSRFLNSSSVGGYNWRGGYTPSYALVGVLIPASIFFDNFYGGGIDVSARITVYNQSSSAIGSINIVFSGGGDKGNSPDGFIITTQDTSYQTQTGIASLIQSAILSSVFVENFLVESGSVFTPYRSATEDTFPGMRISIIDPYNAYYNDNIGFITIAWNDSYLSAMAGLGILDSSLLRDPFTSSSGRSFTGITSSVCRLEPYNSQVRRGWIIGGEIG